MLRKHFENKNNDEYGFTLIELLVVILIIGILAAIAIPAFLNQRQRANDSAVQSDVRNVAMQIESELVGNPNGRVATTAAGTGTIRVGVLPSGTPAGTTTLTTAQGVEVKLSPGVVVSVAPGATPGLFTVTGGHTNGKSYKAAGTVIDTNSRLVYDSNSGGFQPAATPAPTTP